MLTLCKHRHNLCYGARALTFTGTLHFHCRWQVCDIKLRAVQCYHMGTEEMLVLCKIYQHLWDRYSELAGLDKLRSEEHYANLTAQRQAQRAEAGGSDNGNDDDIATGSGDENEVAPDLTTAPPDEEMQQEVRDAIVTHEGIVKALVGMGMAQDDAERAAQRSVGLGTASKQGAAQMGKRKPPAGNSGKNRSAAKEQHNVGKHKAAGTPVDTAPASTAVAGGVHTAAPQKHATSSSCDSEPLPVRVRGAGAASASESDMESEPESATAGSEAPDATTSAAETAADGTTSAADTAAADDISDDVPSDSDPHDGSTGMDLDDPANARGGSQATIAAVVPGAATQDAAQGVAGSQRAGRAAKSKVRTRFPFVVAFLIYGGYAALVIVMRSVCCQSCW